MTEEEMAEEYKESKRLHCIPKERYIIEEQESRLTEIKQAFLAGLEKANEWHYVKYGDLPKHENYVLVSNGKDWTKGFYKDKKWNIIHFVGLTKIIMWKEIELPKE